MTVKELYNRQLIGDWTTSGLDVQWRYSKLDDSRGLLEFQCTQTTDDWIENLKFWPHKSKSNAGVYIHDGFYDMWDSVCMKVSAKSSDLNEGDKLIITGYSQGAALAVLAAMSFRYLGMNVTLVTFGCPRLFWGYVPRQVRKNLAGTHYAVRGDLVTHVPPSLFGYSRGGKCVRIGPKSMIKVEKHEPVNYQNYLPDTEV